MLRLFPYRIRLVRSVVTRRRAGPQKTVGGRSRRAVFAGAAALAMILVPAVPAAAGDSTNFTINTVTLSITVTPGTGTFGNCFLGNSTRTQLGFPNGQCSAPVDNLNNVLRITIANTGGNGHVVVQGSAAVPSVGTGNWTLCVGGGSTPCNGPAAGAFPGVDQMSVSTIFPIPNSNGAGSTAARLTTAPQCDSAIDGPATVPAAEACALAAGASAQEWLFLIGPSATTNPSATFTTTVTWTIVL